MYFIKLYIITYNNDKVLNNALDTLYNSDFIKFKNTQVNIINNFTDINIKNKYISKVNIINNNTRGDFFDANLAENHNQAIIHGFKNLKNPDTEIVVHTHNDINFTENWVNNMIECFKIYNFIVGSLGDQFVAYKVDAIKKIGLWDENFIGVCHKEADYYLRAFLLNKEKSYINDKFHLRTLNNKIDYKFDNIIRSKSNNLLKQKIVDANLYSQKYFKEKWKNTTNEKVEYHGWLVKWDEINLKDKLKKLPFNIKLFMKYYFFEKDIETLEKQNYFI